MNVAYLDPPYSRYFHKLAVRLVQPSGGDVVALLSCPAYRLYAGGDRTEVWTPGEPAQAHDVPPAFERAGWAQTDSPEFRRAFSHAVEWFKERFAAERTDVCLVFSDARPFWIVVDDAHNASALRPIACVSSMAIRSKTWAATSPIASSISTPPRQAHAPAVRPNAILATAPRKLCGR